MFRWQQQKSKQIHAWAPQIPIMSLHLIFQGKKEGFCSEHQHTRSSQQQIGIAVLCLISWHSWQGKFSLEDETSGFWNMHASPLLTYPQADLVEGYCKPKVLLTYLCGIDRGLHETLRLSALPHAQKCLTHLGPDSVLVCCPWKHPLNEQKNKEETKHHFQLVPQRAWKHLRYKSFQSVPQMTLNILLSYSFITE